MSPEGPIDPRALAGGVGAGRRHDSAEKHVAGAAHYVDDAPEPPGTLHVQFGLSDVAHGRIVEIDLADVRATPGVVAVLTAADIPGRNDVSPIMGDDPLFADDVVSYCGQALFAVAAETRDAARRAARRARLTIEERPAILTIDAAMDAQSWLAPPYVMRSGAPEDAIAAAPHQIEGRIRIGGQEHFYLEGQAALAIPGEDGDVTLLCSSQHPSEIQHKCASVLGLPYNAVTVEVRRMGGAFGGKESQGNLPACAAALVAAKTGRPAKVVYDRDDDMMLTGKRHDFRIDYRAGVDADGRILGLIVDHALRCGMSWDLSEPIGDRAMFHADNAYVLPNAQVTSYRCRTHTQSNTAFRGFGGPQGMLGMERVIDHIAAQIGRDPLAVRRANFYAPRGAPDAGRSRTHYGMTVADCVIADIVDDLVADADYDARRAAVDAWNDANPYIKRGLALTPVKFGISFTKTFLNQAGALLHVYSDGSIGLNHGGTEMGQGLFVKVAQIVAEVFQVDVDRVKITATNTGKVPNTSATAASSGADLNGMAAKVAAEEIKRRMTTFLAERHGVAEDDVEFRAGAVRIGGDQRLSFSEAVSAAYMARVPLSSTGFYATPKITWDRGSGTGRPFFYFAYGAALTEAAVDVLTGESRLLRADLLHDVGRSLNPAIDLGQIEGGYVQGAGWLTTEELVWDDKGRLTTHAPSTYKIPACADRPREMRVRLFDRGENTEETVFRSKAVGEPPLMLGMSAFFAIVDAVRAAGPVDAPYYPSLDAPATPERVLWAIERLRAETAR